MNGKAFALSSFSRGVVAGVWTHMAGVYDPSVPSARLYINGALAATQTASVPGTQYNPAAVNVAIGNRSDGGTTRRDGKIDEVRIYGRALSAAEVGALIQPLRFVAPAVANKKLILNWTGLGQLQSAPTVTGVYTNIIPAPSPPYTNAIVPGRNQFFRLQVR
jgi:hypothetical protein